MLLLSTATSCYSRKIKILCAILAADALKLLIEVNVANSLSLLHQLVLVIPKAFHHILLINQQLIQYSFLPSHIDSQPLYLQWLIHVLTIFFVIIVILDLNIKRWLLQHRLDVAEALRLLQLNIACFIILHLLLQHFDLLFASGFFAF